MIAAQHTNWEYDFIMIQEDDLLLAQEKAVNMLLNGEVDLIGSIFNSDEYAQYFEYPKSPSGVSRHTLASLNSNNKINRNNYFLQETIKIALVEDEVLNFEYFYMVDGRGYEDGIVFVDTHDEAFNLLLNGDVDVIINNDNNNQSWQLNSLTTIDRRPFYFVSKAGNTDIINQLDNAMTLMYIEEPNVSERLFNEYFSSIYDGNITLTDDEALALQDYDYLTIGLMNGLEPYQFYDENNYNTIPTGISVEILEQISSIIGVDFRYVWVNSHQEMKEKIASREIDIVSTIPYDSQYVLTSFLDVIVTQPFVTNDMVWLHNHEEQSIIQPMYYYVAENIHYYPDDEIYEITDIEKQFSNLSAYGSTSIFTDLYIAQYYIGKLGLDNIDMQILSSIDSKICFGVGKHLDSAVVGLINNSILHLNKSIVDEIIYNNVTTTASSMTVAAFWKKYSLPIFLIFLLLTFVVVHFLVGNSKKFKELSQTDSLTKLYNAGYFHNYVQKQALLIDSGCLILIDIDFFKQVNDTHGHQKGDEAIVRVANTLKRYFRDVDIVARLGGDEFIIFLETSLSVEDLQERCKAILEVLVNDDKDNPVTLSIGGYIFNKQTDYSKLYNFADSVLYKVKENGRNGYLFDTSEQLDC